MARCGNQDPGQREKENRADDHGHCQAARGDGPFHTYQDIKRQINGKNFFSPLVQIWWDVGGGQQGSC